jgi:RNA polymerase sigma factor (sigma-70 family)
LLHQPLTIDRSGEKAFPDRSFPQVSGMIGKALSLLNRKKPEEYSDLEVVDGCLSGKSQFEEILYHRYSGRLMAICRRYAKSQDEAQDVFHDAFVRIFQHLHTFDRNGSFEGWMKRICVNTAINNFRKNKDTYQHLDVTETEDLAHTEMNALDSLSNQELIEMINRLPEGYRMVFNLHAIEGYTHPEIAEMLNIAEGTSKSQLVKAKAYLKQLLALHSITGYENR